MVYRLVAKFRKRPQVSSLLPGKRGRKASARALSVAAEAVVRDAIADVYLQPEKPRLSDLLKEIQRQCQRKGLRMPNFRTVKRRVDALDAKEHLRKRAGAKAANDRFRPTRVLSTTDLLPLERVQIDHTRVDVIVVDEGDRLPIGRPWLTLAIDVASRAVLGFSVSLEGPSVVSVALTLVQAVLPKARLDDVSGAAGVQGGAHVVRVFMHGEKDEARAAQSNARRWRPTSSPQ